MSWHKRVMAIRTRIKRNIALYKALYLDPRTPRLARVLLWLAIAYALSPIDLIPDFIPGVGHLDDVIIVPLLAIVAVKLVPHEVYEEHRNKATKKYPRADS